VPYSTSVNQETVNQPSALKNLKVNLIPSDSATYGRRLVKAIREAFEHGVYFCPADEEGGIRVKDVSYQAYGNLITVRSFEGKRHVGPSRWDQFNDGYGRSIVASRASAR
jgi:hypothetical protein